MTDAATALPSAAERVAEIPLIPREALFGNPTRAGGQISPDGAVARLDGAARRGDERLARAGERSRPPRG